ncbi:16S rRNA (guanine(966)-N(2))-methyltransferase RsmD [Alkalibaculum sporogenes]|nr:16S rRNA (guanine(966)-N(2))-methyltransferase RsmD [Alkalibaculum sporogenes]
MRVITGKAKGKKLYSPKDDRVRPTSDKIKQSFFNIIDSLIKDSVFIDCFSGTGAIGIEALSRGAKEVYFIDNNKESVLLIKKNLNTTDLNSMGNIIEMNVEDAISNLSKENVIADIIFMDPPYALDIIPSIIKQISKNNILSQDGIIVAEHDKKYIPEETILDYQISNKRVYGNTTMTYYKRLNL